MEDFVASLNAVLWSTPVIYILLGIGFAFSIMTRFLQVRHLKEMIVQMFKGKSSEAGVSSFQALSIALSGRCGHRKHRGSGDSNCIRRTRCSVLDVGDCLYRGGECLCRINACSNLQSETRRSISGRPAYYIEKGLGIKWFAVLFAAAALIAMVTLMPGVQSNSIAAGIQNAFGISPFVTGCGLVLLLGFIIFGGVKRIASAAQMIVPFILLDISCCL